MVRRCSFHSSPSLANTQVSIAAEVAFAYLDLRSAQVRMAVARENLASQEETLQIARWRVQARADTADGSAPCMQPCSSMRARSSASP